MRINDESIQKQRQMEYSADTSLRKTLDNLSSNKSGMIRRGTDIIWF